MHVRIFALAGSLFTTACFGAMYGAPAGVAATTSTGDVSAQARASAARTLGYPTRKTAAELDALVTRQTAKFTRTGTRAEGRLESPAPLSIRGKRLTCYTVVMRLGDGASWGPGAEGGVRFDFQTPTTHGSGGPGVTGPGAVASLGCAMSDGPITLTMAPLFGADPLGQGPYTLEVYAHALSAAEYASYQADQRQQSDDAAKFAASEAAKKNDRLSKGCATCESRYQGCVGSGQSESTCRNAFSSCAFEQAGPDYYQACAHP